MSVVVSVPVDTTPGAAHVFAPPEGFDGDTEAYVNMMRFRWCSVESKQRIYVCARQVLRQNNPEDYVSGPYAEQALSIIRRVL